MSSRSSPATRGPHRLARPRTSPFHGGNGGSNPPGDAKLVLTWSGLANAPRADSLSATTFATPDKLRRYYRPMRWIALLLIGLRTATCCTVVPASVKEALKQAEIVFRGRITEVRDQEIIFQVERVWKGHIPTVFAMPKLIWSSTPCIPGFYQGYVKKGAELLVYARRMPEINER